jgi:cyclophilin family peptidyl-prolyl cis-trans isomerase
LAAIVVGLFVVGVGLASGAIRFGGGSGTNDAFAYGSGGPLGSAAGSQPLPGAAAGGSGAPAGGIAGCPASQPAAAPAGKKQVVTIATAKGTIEVTLVDDLSPVAVGNFAALASCGYYDGVVYHRIVPGFVIQGGDGEFGRTPGYDPSRAGTGGPGYTIQDEPVTTTYQRGTVAMARTAQPNSVGSQFFIVLADAARTSLASANTYQIIGSVTNGMEVADAIAAAADQENPSQPIAMTKVTVASPTP